MSVICCSVQRIWLRSEMVGRCRAGSCCCGPKLRCRAIFGAAVFMIRVKMELWMIQVGVLFSLFYLLLSWPVSFDWRCHGRYKAAQAGCVITNCRTEKEKTRICAAQASPCVPDSLLTKNPPFPHWPVSRNFHILCKQRQQQQTTDQWRYDSYKESRKKPRSVYILVCAVFMQPGNVDQCRYRSSSFVGHLPPADVTCPCHFNSSEFNAVFIQLGRIVCHGFILALTKTIVTSVTSTCVLFFHLISYAGGGKRKNCNIWLVHCFQLFSSVSIHRMKFEFAAVWYWEQVLNVSSFVFDLTVNAFGGKPQVIHSAVLTITTMGQLVIVRFNVATVKW